MSTIRETPIPNVTWVVFCARCAAEGWRATCCPHRLYQSQPPNDTKSPKAINGLRWGRGSYER